MTEEVEVKEVAAPLDIMGLASVVIETEDLTVDKAFTRELPRAGVALLRFKDYIELGRYPSKNPAHKPGLKAILEFELNHPEHLIELEDGTKVPQTLQVRVNKGSTGASGYRKLFKAMNRAAGGDKQHFLHMLGMPFLAEIYHNDVGEGADKKTYANLDIDGAWSFKKPEQVDTMTNIATPLVVMEQREISRVFMWEVETTSDEQIVAMWDSIFIEGEREDRDANGVPKKNAAGEPIMKSKNWLQEQIMTNMEWEDSRTQALTQDMIEIDELSMLAENAEENDPALVAAEAKVALDEAPTI